MTRIDRYILTLFLRTSLICFASLSGIFIVFHAFTSMDDLVQMGQRAGSLPIAMAQFYGPYVLLLFDSTGAVIIVMSLLFTAAWLTRTGELTATLSAGVSHGRIFRPMVIAAIAVVALQTINREFVLPKYSRYLTLKADVEDDAKEQPVLAQYDKLNRILIDGRSVELSIATLHDPHFRIDGDYRGFGDALRGQTAVWQRPDPAVGWGYRVSGVSEPKSIDQIASVRFGDRTVLFTAADTSWLSAGECFVATDVRVDYLATAESSQKLASVVQLLDRVRNPAIHSSDAVKTRLHGRLVRPPLDVALFCLVLPLAAAGRGKNLFVMMAAALGTVLVFFVIKSTANVLGSGGYVITPIIAGWLPLMIVGPIGYMRWRAVAMQ